MVKTPLTEGSQTGARHRETSNVLVKLKQERQRDPIQHEKGGQVPKKRHPGGNKEKGLQRMQSGTGTKWAQGRGAHRYKDQRSILKMWGKRAEGGRAQNREELENSQQRVPELEHQRREEKVGFTHSGISLILGHRAQEEP